MFVCCVLSGRGLCDELITRPGGSYRLWRVVITKPRERGGHSPRWAAEPEKITNNNLQPISVPLIGLLNLTRLFKLLFNWHRMSRNGLKGKRPCPVCERLSNSINWYCKFGGSKLLYQ
jgi:hypothetical protein